MIATIISAQESITQMGRPIIRLTVLDDHEQKRTVIIALEAIELLRKFLKNTHTTVIRKKNGYIEFNLNKLVGKIISVSPEVFRGEEMLRFNPKWEK